MALAYFSGCDAANGMRGRLPGPLLQNETKQLLMGTCHFRRSKDVLYTERMDLKKARRLWGLLDKLAEIFSWVKNRIELVAFAIAFAVIAYVFMIAFVHRILDLPYIYQAGLFVDIFILFILVLVLVLAPLAVYSYDRWMPVARPSRTEREKQQDLARRMADLLNGAGPHDIVFHHERAECDVRGLSEVGNRHVDFYLPVTNSSIYSLSPGDVVCEGFIRCSGQNFRGARASLTRRSNRSRNNRVYMGRGEAGVLRITLPLDWEAYEFLISAPTNRGHLEFDLNLLRFTVEAVPPRGTEKAPWEFGLARQEFEWKPIWQGELPS